MNFKIREDFPSLKRTGKKTPIYLDNACVTLRPRTVIEEMNKYYFEFPGCHNRSVHEFGEKTDKAYLDSKQQIANFFSMESWQEVIFTKNTTEGLNLVAKGLSFQKGDKVLTSNLEHNSNLLPWQFLVHSHGIEHLNYKIDIKGNIDLDEFEKLLQSGVKIVSTFSHSHVLGIRQPIEKMVELTKKYNALFLLDAAQSLAHEELNFKKLGIDLMVCSFHKAFGPSGMGCLVGKKDVLEELNPLLVGGETVRDVSKDSCEFSPLPDRLEGGLQNYAGAMGSAQAIKFIQEIGFKNILKHEKELVTLLLDELKSLERVQLLGPSSPNQLGSLVNFSIDGVDSGELSIMLAQTENIMVRSGVHCAHAWYKENELQPTLRASFSLYNTAEEVEKFVKTIKNFIRFY